MLQMKYPLLPTAAVLFFALRLSAGSQLVPPTEPIPLESIENYVIVLPDSPDPQSVRGAERLVETVRKICGVRLPVTGEKVFKGGPAFYLGATRAAAERKLKGPDALDGYRIAVDGCDVFLLGNRRGPAQAVFALVEEDWGVRWYALSAPKIYPHRTKDAFCVSPREYVPPFLFRELIDPAAMDGDWSAFNRYQPISYFSSPDFADGGALANGRYFCHTYDMMIPAKRFFEAHPEYFPLVKGKRFRSTQAHGQLCYTSPGLEDELVRQYEAAIAKRPECIHYACAANDNLELGCGCPPCARLIAADGIVGAQLDLANRVADRLAEKRPDILIKTTAYVVTQNPPPNVRPGKNVVVEYCPIQQRAGSDIYRPWRSHAVIRRQFDAWLKTAPNVSVWDYALDWDMTPMPNFETMHDNIRFWRECGVKGVLIQETETNRVNLQELRAWIFSKLLWNPDYDLEELVREFMHGHYGPSGDAMLGYYRRQMAVYRDFRKRDRPDARASLRFDTDVIKGLRESLEAAWAAADGDETVRARIASEICAFLALPLMGCPRDRIEQYRKDLDLVKTLTKRYDIALCSVNTSVPSVEKRNRARIARWEKILAKASTADPLPVYCRDSITLPEKRPWYQCRFVKDPGALTPDPVRHPHAGGWLTQWDYSELVATAPNQTFYVARVRIKGDICGTHKPSDAAISFAISRLGDNVSPGMKIRFGDLPGNGEWGFVYLARIHLYTVSPKGYFYNADLGLGKDDAILFDYLEFIPEEQFKDRKTLEKLPTLVL